jgi:hypothetical protein
MASNKLEVSDLDYSQIRENLKKFLQSQSEFQDYNFEGSGMAVLLDLLAYNSHYLSFNANMLANEMYLDSADLRKNIVSIAKMIGYTPTSVRSPVAVVNILLRDATGASVTMPKGTTFTSLIGGETYKFITNEAKTITPSSGVYQFSNVSLYEGTLVNYNYTVDSTDPDQRFIIPSAKVDTSTLKVQVQNSISDTTISTYTLASGITELDSTSKVYFIQEIEDGKFEIYFGDGVIGKSLSDGNIVRLEYIVTNITEANGASSFTLSGTINGFSDVVVSVVSSAQGGVDAETKESIRYNAPLQYSAQDRAVTTSDYETLVKEIYPNALSVSAWGGEDDETPVYGTVKIAIKAASGSTLTNTTKESIKTSLKKYNIASVNTEIIDPETTSIILTSNVRYDEKATTKTSDTLKSNILNSLSSYNTSTLQKFDTMFRYSKIVELIDDVDTSILSNITTLKIRKNFTPTLGSSTRYDIYFRNGLYNPHSGHKSEIGGILSSTGFKVTGDTTNVYYLDDDGAGNVRRYYLVSGVRTYANNTQGTINYSTGQITINSLNIGSVENIRGSTSTVIELTVQTSSNDIIPVRDQILEIDTENSIINVEADTFVGGSADAGVGYNTTTSY